MSEARRVAFVIWSLGLGGAEQVILRLAASLDRRRFLPLICCLDEPGPFAAEASRSGVEVVALHKRGRFDVRVLRPLVHLLRGRRIDVVHTHLWSANLWGRLGAVLAGRPAIVATEHNADTWKRPYHFVLDRWLARRSTRLVGVARHVAEFYEARGVGRGLWQVIHNGVETEPGASRQEARAALGVSPTIPLVGFVGRFAPAKGPEDFVQAVAIAARTVPSLEAVMIGDGPLRARVEAARAQSGLGERLRLVGLRSDVRALLPAFDALLVCSEREGLSLAVLEAMAAGVPVVATEVGGTTELVEADRTGLLVPVGRPDAMAARLLGLLGEPALGERLRREAHARVRERFSLRNMVEAHEALYASFPSAARTGPP